MLLSVAAMAVIAVLTHVAARHNATVRQYDAAQTRLQAVMRALGEAALTEGSQASVEGVRSGLEEFRLLRYNNAELNADTREIWPDLDRQVEDLVQAHRNAAFDEDAMIELGRISRRSQQLGNELQTHAAARTAQAASAEFQIQVANVVAALLLILGTAGFFIIRENTRKALDSARANVAELKRLDRMKSEFISTVSHELRTPLTSIRGSLGLIAGGIGGALPEGAKGLIEIAKDNCERLVRLINDMLDIQKIESGEMRFDLKVVELAPLLVEAIAANEGFAAQHGVTLNLLGGGEAVRVDVDSDGLLQVLTNLLSNAVKFSPTGGTVDVSLRRIEGRVRVEVRDWGPGIPDEFRSRIFQKFSQADSSDTRQKGGTGLGLNISKAIVERLGGTIGFETPSGAGTMFYFELPESRGALAVVSATGQGLHTYS
jgi:signal transduction histidine kinase